MPLVVHEAVPPLQRLGPVSVDQFLAHHWQREPCLLQQVFPDFAPALDENDIAGLACEEFADSRLVAGRYPDHDWSVSYGPFDELTLGALPERDWTLLVQDVEKHFPPLRALLRRFGFLPAWRLDDLMVSVSAPGGSVGPHVDRYDVFLLQASGHRRWEIARRFDPSPLPECELDVLRCFVAEECWELGPGDVLYLPPGIAHHGTALDTGMTWSIGFRAPSQADLLAALAEWLAGERGDGRRYTDAPNPAAAVPGQIDADARRRLRELLEPGTDLDVFLGGFLTTYRLARRPAPPDCPISSKHLARHLARGALLRRDPWTRLAWLDNGDGAYLFASGETFRSSRRDAQLLCAADTWRSDGAPCPPEQLELLAGLVNAGHLHLGQGP